MLPKATYAGVIVLLFSGEGCELLIGRDCVRRRDNYAILCDTFFNIVFSDPNIGKNQELDAGPWTPIVLRYKRYWFDRQNNT